MSNRVLAAALAAAFSVPAWSQTPVGPEIQVNVYTSLNQGVAALAAGASGGFVVAWQSYGQDGSMEGVFARRYDALGNPAGPEIPVNSHTTNRQNDPAIASDAAGNFVVVWQSLGQDGSGYGIFAQRFSAAGARRGEEVRVNSLTLGEQRAPAVASDASGNFVVVWTSLNQDGSLDGVFGQRFDGSGARRGEEFNVNSATLNTQFEPDVASDADGNFVVVWASANQDGHAFGVVGQRFDASGAREGYEFLANSFSSLSQRTPVVASDPAGNFVVVWQSYAQDGSGWGVFGQRHDASGNRRGAEFRVNTSTALHQYLASAATDASGNFLVVWTGWNAAGTSREIFVRRFAASGAAGPEVRANSFTTQAQNLADVAATGNGDFVVAWGSDTQDLSHYGVFAQMFSTDPIFRNGFE